MEFMLYIVVAFGLMLALVDFFNTRMLQKQGYDMGRVPLKPHKNQKIKPNTPKPNFNPPKMGTSK